MLHGTRVASDESAFVFEHPQKIAVSGESGADLITVPDANLLFNGDFQRSGSDLKIVGDGTSFLIPDYFKGEKNPTLLSPDGAALTGDIVEALAGPLAPGQYAQAGAQTADEPAIGRVEQVEGNATIVRNGVAIAANQGDVVRKGDVVQTGGDGKIAVLFADGSTFSLSASARMVLNDFVYQAGGSNNSALISLVQGTIGFVAGQVAKSGDMRVDTPVATMGIRGTAVLIEISANNGQTKFSVLVEPNGTTGSYNLYNKTTGALIATVNNSAIGWVVSPAGPLQVIAQQINKTPGELQQELNYFQNIFNLFNNGQNNPFVPEQRTDNPDPQNTNGQGTQFTTNLPNNQPYNPNSGNPTGPVTVTVTPVNTGNNNDPTPNNNTGDTPDIVLPGQQTTFNVIYGTQFNDNDGTGFNDQPYIVGTEIDDFVYAGAGNDVIIAGHGGGDDYYDGDRSGPGPLDLGGPGFDTIAFPSATAAQPLVFHLKGITAQNTADGPVTDHDIFTNIERIESGAGDDTFFIYNHDTWEIDGGAGIDTLTLVDDLSFRDSDVDGPSLTNFEIIDLNSPGANTVDFDIFTKEMTENSYIHVIGDTNDKINLIDYSAEYSNGRWQLQQMQSLSESGGETSPYAIWIYVSGEETVFTMYVGSDIQVDVIEDVQVTVIDGGGYDLSTLQSDLANAYFEEPHDGEIQGWVYGKRIVLSVEDGEGEARVTSITVYNGDNGDAPPLLTATGFNIPLSALQDALDDGENLSALEAIFQNVTYEVLGNVGNDTLVGGAYRDYIDGSAGDDTMTGGGGRDMFFYNGGDDTIKDFSVGGGDQINLTAFQFLHSMADIGPRAQYDDETGNTTIDLGYGKTLTLEGVNIDDLTDDDFIFYTPPHLIEAGAAEIQRASSSTTYKVLGSNGENAVFDPTGWTSTGGAASYNGHSYKFISGNMSWTDARAAALAMGGYLATITSAGENAFIDNNVAQNRFAWIGANDAAMEGQWHWADGPDGGQSVYAGFTGWWGQEPNGGTAENYAYIDPNAAWTDVSLSDQTVQGYVVEFNGTGFVKVGTYGSVIYNSTTGQLTYTLNNGDADTQGLAAAQTVTDSFTLTFTGTNGELITQTATFTIEGTNDAPLLAQPSETVLTFDGTDSARTAPVTTNVGNGLEDGITLEAWFAWDGSPAQGAQFLFGNGNGADAGIMLFGETNTKGEFVLGVLRGGQDIDFTNVTLGVGEWHHLAVTRENGLLTLYVDGEVRFQTSASVNGIPGPSSEPDYQDFTQIGENFHGSVAEFRVWTEARTQPEILETQFASLTGNEPHLAGYWPLDGGQHNLTFVGDPEWTISGAPFTEPVAYTEDGDPVAIAPSLRISEVDDILLNGATVKVSDFEAGDVLGFVSQNGITGSYNAQTGILTLSGAATVASYQTALRSVTFASTSDDPSGLRTITLQVNDGSGDSNIAAATVSVTPVDDAPTSHAPEIHIGSATTTEEGSSTMLSDVFVTDADEGDLFTATIVAQHGTLELADNELNAADQDPTNEGMRFTNASLSQVNEALADGVIYTTPIYDPENPEHHGLTDKVTLTVTDKADNSDSMNFIFSVFGEAGATLTGEDGKDVLFGTGHNDTLTGSGGADTFVFSAETIYWDEGQFTIGSGQDTITDFTQGQDKVALYEIYDNYADMVASGAFTNPELDSNQIDLGDGNSITLNGVQVSSLTANDFIFHPGT